MRRPPLLFPVSCLAVLSAVLLCGSALPDDPKDTKGDGFPTVKGGTPSSRPGGPIPPNGKRGAGAYDNLPEPRKSRLVKDWETELASLKQARKADVDRLAAAKTPAQRQKFERAIKDYDQRLARHLKNDPPYDGDAERAKAQAAAAEREAERKKREEAERAAAERRRAEQGVTRENYTKITIGMKWETVFEILGKTGAKELMQSPGYQVITWERKAGRDTILINVHFRNNVVESKSILGD